MSNLNPKTLIMSWEEVYISVQQFLEEGIKTQRLSIGYIPTYSLVFNISQITMVLEIKKSQGTFQSFVKKNWSILS